MFSFTNLSKYPEHANTPPTLLSHVADTSTGQSNLESSNTLDKQRPLPLRIHSSPPESTMNLTSTKIKDQNIHQGSGTVTPPPTPLIPKNRKGSLSSRSDTGYQGRASIDSMISDIPGSTDLREFPYGIIEYEIDKTKLLGTGLWSDVYFAAPSLPKATSTTSPTEVPYNTESILTPPLTPVKHRNSLSRSSAAALPPIPCAYAIKVPTSRQAKAVFEAEARILSYLSSFPRAGDHIVPFFGLDTRNQAIIMGALPQTLETFVTTELASLSEEGRTEKLASIFPPLALYLIRGLEWLTEKGCVHADIKPGNILLSDTVRPIYADFSSAIFLYEQPTSQGPLGGGTWDFLCPSLLRSAASAAGRLTPSTKTDLYSLAIALLYVIIGGSPFDSAGSNAFRRREMAKSGNPLLWAFGGDEGWKSEKRIKELSKRVGWDVQQFLKMGLEKLEMRVEVGVWREELEGKTGGS